MDTPQNEVIVDEELGQGYNPKDEDIVFINDESEIEIEIDCFQRQ